MDILQEIQEIEDVNVRAVMAMLRLLKARSDMGTALKFEDLVHLTKRFNLVIPVEAKSLVDKIFKVVQVSGNSNGYFLYGNIPQIEKLPMDLVSQLNASFLDPTLEVAATEILKTPEIADPASIESHDKGEIKHALGSCPI